MKNFKSIFSSQTAREIKNILFANKKYFYIYLFITLISSLVEYICLTSIFDELDALNAPLKIELYSILILWLNIIILSLTRILSIKIITLSAAEISSTYSIGIVEEIFKKSFLWHRSKNKNIIINGLTQQQSYALSKFVRPIFQALLSFFNSIGIISAMFLKFGKDAIFFLFFMALFYLFSILSIRKRLQKFSISEAAKEDNRMSIIVDGVTSIRDIYVNNRKKLLIRNYKENTKKYYELGNKIHFLSSLPKLYLDAIILIIIGLIVSFYTNYNSVLNISFILSFGLSFQKLLPNIVSIGGTFNSISSGKGSLLAVSKLRNGGLDLQNNFKNRIIAINLKDSESKDIKWVNLTINSFNRKWSEDNLKDAQININKINGIEGFSGSGKTTLVDILCGLLPLSISNQYELYLLINNKKQNGYIDRDFSSNVYYITQETYLERDTIENNLKKDFEFSFDIKQVLKTACLDKYLKSYKKRLTSDLSGGEKKRLAIAKALVSKKSIIIMDEITNGLDNQIKQKILLNLARWKDKHKLTYIVISHDEDVLEWCDNIIRL